MKPYFVIVAAAVLSLFVTQTADAFPGFVNHSRLRDERAISAVTRLNASNLATLADTLYAKDVVFQDPTTKIDGRDAFKAHLATVYGQIALTDITVSELVGEGDTRIVVWELHGQLEIGGKLIGSVFTYAGNTVLHFDCHDQITSHRDYYDQLPLYQQIPGFDAALGQMLQQFILQQLSLP